VPTDTPREVTTLRRLHQLMSQVNAHTDLQELLQLVVDGVADVVGFQVAVVSYFHPDQTFEVMAVAGDEDARAQLMGNRTALTSFTAEFEYAEEWGTLRFIPHENLPEEDDALGWVPDFEPLEGPDAWHPMDALFAPLSAPTGEMIGMLAVDLPHDRMRPGQFQREVLEMYAVQAGIAINNARQRRALVERIRLGEAVRAVIQAAGGDLDLGRVIDDSVLPIVSGLRCNGAWIRAFAGEGELPGRGRGAVYPNHPPLIAPDEMLSLAERIATHCWAEQRAQVVSETVTVPPELISAEEMHALMDFTGRIGAHSMMFIPLGAGPECLGYMVLTRSGDAPPWSEEEMTACLGIGRDLGRAVLHARLFEREREIITELQQLDLYKSELISMVSHELKSPLTSIMLSLEFLQSSETAPESQQWLGAIERNTNRLRSLVEDLLLLSKVRDPNQPLTPSRVDLAATLTEAVEAYQMQADRAEVRVELAETAAAGVAWGDPTELACVVSNLLSNAIKYSPPGSKVRLGLRTDGETVELTCADQGFGISPADQERLFTEFFRSNNPTALSKPGTGLGLTIVKRIVDRHEGDISVSSASGEGSTFTVTLPAPRPHQPS